MKNLKCINKIIYEVEEDEKYRGKLHKYSGDIAAGALGTLTGIGAAAYSRNEALTGAGIYEAYKLHDVKSVNYDKINKTKTGSLIGAHTEMKAATLGDMLYLYSKPDFVHSMYNYSDDYEYFNTYK